MIARPANTANTRDDERQSNCLACGSERQTVFYQQHGIPVHSCVLTTTKQAALDFPRGDLRLVHCVDCGFISNQLFSETSVSYAAGYEDQQSFSPVFNQFSLDLAKRLVEKYDLHDKRIVEIGCGKGDFLASLCTLGANVGFGIDPSADPARQPDTVAERVTFVREVYSEDHQRYAADFVCCRHTLEHVHNVAEFLRTVRRTLGQRTDTGIFFEVPDATRILQDVALEDIYYEHCSYFTPGSLGRLFRACGFEVVDLYRAYGEQYLMIETRPAIVATNQAHQLEEAPAENTEAVDHFRTNAIKKRRLWLERLAAMKDKRLAIWGSGSKCVAFLSTLDCADRIPCVIDINPHRHGKFIPGVGLEIRAPEYLLHYKPEHIIVMNGLYLAEIRLQLDELNVVAKLTAL